MNFTTLLSKATTLFIICFFFPLYFLIGEENMLKTNQKNRPQEPKPHFPYVVEEVSYGNSEISLSGTLTLPMTTGPFPAVILIHGSSRLDRDETILGHKPFLILSDHFTRHGIAVLRFDKRGVGKSTGTYDNATIEDFCDDVAKGVEYLKSRPEIIRNQIGLVGHSEGGIVAPMLAAKSNDVAFIVLMAGTGVNGEEILCEQGRLIHRLDGVDEEMIAIDTQIRKIFTGIVKKETNRDVAKEQIHEALIKFFFGLTESQKTWVKSHSIITEEWIKRFNSPWGHFYFSYESSTALRHITIPMLVLNGELDLVVSPKQNLPFIDKALKEAGNKDYTIIELPKLNHVFQTCVIGSWDEYEQTEETIAPSALNIMTDWILERTTGCMDQQSSIVIEVLKGNEVIPYLKKWIEIRLLFYKDYPYLYDGTMEGEEHYLRMYSNSENTLLVMAKRGEEIIGAVIGLPLPESPEENKDAFQEAGMLQEELFYLGDSIVTKEFKTSNVQEQMYHKFESAVKHLEKYRGIVVCEIERDVNDPKKVANDTFYELAWNNRGFIKEPNQTVLFSWQEIDDVESSDHRMVFWRKVF